MMIPGIIAHRRAVSGGGNADAQAILASLISWWDFTNSSGSSFLDSHGSNNIVAVGGPAGATTGAGKVGVGLSGVCRMASAATLQFGDESFTIFLWHYPASGEPAVAVMCGKYATVDGGRAYEVSRISGTNSFQVNISANGTAVTSLIGPTKTPVDTAYDLIAFGYNAATDKVFLIVNGARQELSHAGGSYSGSSARFAIGARSDGAAVITAASGGNKDSVGVMSGAITDAQYAVLYNGGSGLDYAGLVALT